MRRDEISGAGLRRDRPSHDWPALSAGDGRTGAIECPGCLGVRGSDLGLVHVASHAVSWRFGIRLGVRWMGQLVLIIPPSMTMSAPTMLAAAWSQERDERGHLFGFGYPARGDAGLAGMAARNSWWPRPLAAATLPPKPSGSRHSEVPTTPGETVFMRTPRGANSSLSRLPKAVSAALASL